MKCSKLNILVGCTLSLLRFLQVTIPKIVAVIAVPDSLFRFLSIIFLIVLDILLGRQCTLCILYFCLFVWKAAFCSASCKTNFQHLYRTSKRKFLFLDLTAFHSILQHRFRQDHHTKSSGLRQLQLND